MTNSSARASAANERVISHLLRRVGFGGTGEEVRYFSDMSYECAVDELLDAVDAASMPLDLIRRYHPDQSDMSDLSSVAAKWIYKMVTTDAPLVEKIALFWHRVFATAHTKLNQGSVMDEQIEMFREYGLGSFREILVQLSKNPAMILFLDNQDNHKDSVNENYGREILELFSMGVGNYSEEDVRQCARAFTGWTIENADYMALRMRNDTSRPNGFVGWHYKYDESDHDGGQKTFLGKTGNFDGNDVIDIICEQPATASFIARHIYHYFVADEPPVPSWNETAPVDSRAIKIMTDAYFESDYSIKAMLRALLCDRSFRSAPAIYGRIKSPIELVVGVIKMTGGYTWPTNDVYEAVAASDMMGQNLLAPPSVEGWMGGDDWISTGSLVWRVNFASATVGNLNNSGVREMVSSIRSRLGPNPRADFLLDSCLEQLGKLAINEETKKSLTGFIESQGFDFGRIQNGDSDFELNQLIVAIMQLAVSTREFQKV